jgi:hypothetical protein
MQLEYLTSSEQMAKFEDVGGRAESTGGEGQLLSSSVSTVSYKIWSAVGGNMERLMDRH